MSAFTASVWAIRFDGVPPEPAVIILHKDQQWESIEAVRNWISIYLREPFLHQVNAVFIVGRNGNTLVLNHWQATHAETQATELAALRGQREELEQQDRLKTYEISVLVKENNVLRAALTDFVRDAEFRACEESTPGLLLRLAKGRSALADPCRPEPHESKLHAALKETLDCLINETAGNHDTPWVESVKNHANTVLANEH